MIKVNAESSHAESSHAESSHAESSLDFHGPQLG